MSYFPANFLREITATIWEVPYPVPISFFQTSKRKKQMGQAYRDLTRLGFVILSLQSAIKIGEYIIEVVLLELKLVFVFQCFILIYWGGDPKKLPMEKKVLFFNETETQSQKEANFSSWSWYDHNTCSEGGPHSSGIYFLRKVRL